MVKRCGQCVYVEVFKDTPNAFCRRHPPQVNDDGLHTFPVVHSEHDWCGEWADSHMARGETPPTIPTTAPAKMTVKLDDSRPGLHRVRGVR